MKKTTFLFAFAVGFLLAACQGETSSPTAPPFGGTSLTGQVVTMGDLAGASPAGISVTCSGQVAKTDAAGRFAFAGLSTTSGGGLSSLSTGALVLSFTRGDGISASGTVSSAASDVVVYLQKAVASIVATGQSKRELEGPIVSISSTSITVNDASSHGPVTASITSATLIRKGNQTLSASDLKAGDQVHVKASVNSDGSLSAFEIMLQNGGTDDSGGQTKELEGLITAVSQTSITVQNASTGQPETAAITSATVIRKGNQTLSPSDLKVGDRVHVKTASNSDGSLTALEIILQNPGN